MIRRLVAGLIVVGLAVGIWALWPRAGTDPTPTTLPVAAGTTSTRTPSTTSSPLATTTIFVDNHVVSTIEEAEEILRALWFGWFEGIYNQDEDRIRGGGHAGCSAECALPIRSNGVRPSAANRRHHDERLGDPYV